ncbi:MAG: hypothetical protein KDA25_08515, partial [Phycisphaerales bacterium]|nr:hypothetical protein [Phycisphaerales bacterium]
LRIRHQRPSGPIQFDDLEVGEPKYELLVIGPRDSVLVEVAVTFVEAAPLELFDVIIGTDVDGDGEYTDEWSFGFASGPPAAPALPGDLTGDGIVNAADLAQLLASWGACAGCPADLDGDGVVGPSDLAFLLSNWS